MYYLYGDRKGRKTLVATFDSEQQLLAYVRWATLGENGGVYKFEQGSALVGSTGYSYSQDLETDDAPQQVDHNPSPSML
jgi:hypothetical protein